MKKLLSFALALVLIFGMAACGGTVAPAETTPPAAEETGIYTVGTYSATATGMGAVTVTITVDANSITDVVLDVSGETEGIGQAAKEQLTEQILAAQSEEIDGVSGATVTTTAVRVALAGCLAQARGEEAAAEKTPVTDGTYSATASGFSWSGQVTCNITFADNAITEIDVTEETDSATGMLFSTVLDKYIPRVIEAQSLGVDAVTGATYSSNAVKSCVAQAIDLAGGESTEWYTDIEKSTDVRTLEGYDVIVVGLGGSGTLSYCAAADAGATVFGVERAGKIGGNSVHTMGPMAINNQYLKDSANGGEDYIDADDVYNTWMEYVGDEGKADVIYEAVYQSGEALDYYINNFGIEVNGLIGSFARTDWTKLWTSYVGDTVLNRRINESAEYQAALDTAKAMNEKNDYMVELTADSLLTDGDGNITGVSCTSYDGTTYEIYGDSVILATGGFVGNDEMMEEYLGSPVCVFGTTVNDGSGISMAQAVGGALYNIGVLPMAHITQVPNLIKNDDLTADQKAILSALCLTTDQLSVTAEGQVWGNSNHSGTDEGKGITVEIVYAPEYKYYVIYTQDEIDAIATEGLRESYASAVAAPVRLGQGGTFETGTPIADIYDILTVGEEYSDVLKADSIGALADAIGCDEAALSESLGGVDTTYYAVIAAAYAYATVGGLDVDVNMNVLREDGTPIENLYAVGQDSEGVCNASGKAYTPWGGQAQSWTFVSGRIAGTNAALAGMD
ncbi:MAG: FAD-binding protein [Clostridia bacterium]|nr:FAD-binding protein [Clostridia bacterium]